MNLLPAATVQTNENRAETERKARIQRMMDEESDVVRSLNLTKANAKTQTEAINANLEKKRAAALTETQEIETKISSRRSLLADLMRPIDEIRKQAETLLADAKKRVEAVLKREEAVKTDQEALVERTEAVVDREQAVSERETAVQAREDAALAEDARLKESQDKLGEGWTEYHRTVASANDGLKERERVIEDGKVSNEAVRARQDEREVEQNDRDRQLKDQYATLGRARSEFEALKNT